MGILLDHLGNNIPSAPVSSCSFRIPTACLLFGFDRLQITAGYGLDVQLREDHRGGGERRGNDLEVTKLPSGLCGILRFDLQLGRGFGLIWSEEQPLVYIEPSATWGLIHSCFENMS